MGYITAQQIKFLMSKLYRIVKQNAGELKTAIAIEFLAGNTESAAFVAECRQKAIDIFGKGSGYDAINTAYSVRFQFPNEAMNRRMAKLIVKIVEAERELKKIKTEQGKK